MVRLALDPSLIPSPRPSKLAELSSCEDAGATLIEGDNLDALELLCAGAQRFELIYLDPPFFTQRQHRRTKRKRRAQGDIARTESDAFDDRWPSLDVYLATLQARLARLRSLLTDDGSVVIHVDPNTSHYIKVMCDELFGDGCFASEIVWRYRRWPAKTKNFQRVHDVLLRYVKDPKATPRFHQLYEPLAPSTLATWGKSKQRADVDAKGRRRRSTKTAEDSPGTPMGDVWEIGVIAPVARERTGYPTQKPEALLRRIVQGLSLEGDAVLDPYVGSGTTLAVAAALGRRAVGLDQSPEAIAVATSRLEAQGVALRRARVEPLSSR